MLFSITACGGGGGGGGGEVSSSSSSSNPTEVPTSVASNVNQLLTSVDLSDIQSVALVNQSTTVSSLDKFFKFFDNIFSIRSAYASGSGCNNNLQKLVGIDSTNTKKQLQLVSNLTSGGLCELTDIGNYFITTSYKVYKDDKLCNLILLRKSDGKSFCFEESVPVDYSLSVSNGFQGNLQLSNNGNYGYLAVNSGVSSSDAQSTHDFTQSVKLIRFDLSTSTPVIDVVANYDSTNFVAILGFKALNNGNIVIGRMEPSSSSDALNDGYLRLLEYWTFQRTNNTTQKSVSIVDYILTPAGGSRNLNFNCFLDDANSDDSSLLAMFGSTGGYRSTIWRIPKPTTPTASTTPVRLTNEGSSRVCWGSYPYYHGSKIYSIWQGQNGNVDLVETLYDGTESVTNLYNTGNTQGAWSSTYGKISESKDFMLLPKMIDGQSDALLAIRLNATGVVTPISPITVFGTSTGLKISSISASVRSNTFTVTADALPAGGGDRVITKCKFRSGTNDFSCNEMSRVSSTNDFSGVRFFSANPQ